MSAQADTMAADVAMDDNGMSDEEKKYAAANAVETFVKFTFAGVASYLESCVHCGECAEACHFFLTTREPKYTPTYKLMPLVKAYKRHKAPLSSIKKLLGLVPDEVTYEELEEWAPLVYDSCTMCGRCTLVCPMGIDIAGTVRKMREGFVVAGVVPPDLQNAENFALETGSPMGVTLKALKAHIGHQEKETGIPVPLDKKGADYMVLLSSMEIMGFPEIIGALSKIFKKADIDWTISSKAFEGTNVGVQIGSTTVAKELVQRIVDAAGELGVKYVVTPECGHAYGALRWDGPNLIGHQLKFKVLHIIELLDQLRSQGRIRVKDKDARRMTLHDPCQIVRRGGLVDQPRHLINMAADNFVEMKGAGVPNLCCGGGGGVSANSRAHELQNQAFSLKLQQFQDLDDLDLVVSPCANCRTVLEEGLENNEVDLEVTGLSELLAEHLET